MEYELFLLADLVKPVEQQEIVLHVRSTETIEMRVVKAIVSSNPKLLPDGDTLWLRWPRGARIAEPWKITVIDDLGSPAELVAKEYY